MFEGNSGNFLAKIVAEKLAEHSNIGFKCPYKVVR
jgi:hypothetical protein